MTTGLRKCNVCGQDKPGDTGFYGHRSHRNTCKTCMVRQINAHIAQVNEESRVTADNHKERWTELEIEMLIEGSGEGMSGQELAALLGRTYLGVHAKLYAIRKAVCAEPVAERSPKRDRNYVASAPDEDRWWDSTYYKKEQTQ